MKTENKRMTRIQKRERRKGEGSKKQRGKELKKKEDKRTEYLRQLNNSEKRRQRCRFHFVKQASKNRRNADHLRNENKKVEEYKMQYRMIMKTTPPL